MNDTEAYEKLQDLLLTVEQAKDELAAHYTPQELIDEITNRIGES